ncbi:uncharacterized protein LOC121381665 [Gigantopelta aegis]|uniref:uncharacterized protein LOC121381665 n=1 Tax=Gigantopelta aegis TaxID=1735272 RepID=UPI001B887B4A|nr:uncharacterized protein LOC121381665 [Gigantopelta aegis]
MSHRHCYTSLAHPSMKEVINLHNYSALKLAVLVAEFAQQIAATYEHVSKEIQSITTTFRKKNYELKKERPTDTTSTISIAWESLLQETEMDAQAHLDVASLLIKNVYRPLSDVASYKRSQGQKLCTFRENFENLLEDSEKHLSTTEATYYSCYEMYKDAEDEEKRDNAKSDLYNAHNSYVLQLRASNRIADEFHKVIPQVLEELEEIYIDTSNTINVAIETHALLLLTKANEQHRKFDDLLHICRQVNPQMDVSQFVKSVSSDLSGPHIPSHHFHPADDVEDVSTTEVTMKNQLIVDKYTENCIRSQLVELQKEAMQLTVYIKQKQDATNTLINVCQRNLANHMYAKVYETQEEMCQNRNEIRIANMRLAGIRAQIEMLTPKQNGAVYQDQEDDESKRSQSSAIKGMWKKAFKNLKSNEKQNWLTKKGSLIKRKDSKDQGQEETEEEICKEIDPVYSLLKCAADLPKAGKSACSISSKHSSHDSSGNTSKTSSPSSSGENQGDVLKPEIVTQGLGSDFKQFYKLTSPAKKSSSMLDSLF